MYWSGSSGAGDTLGPFLAYVIGSALILLVYWITKDNSDDPDDW